MSRGSIVLLGREALLYTTDIEYFDFFLNRPFPRGNEPFRLIFDHFARICWKFHFFLFLAAFWANFWRFSQNLTRRPWRFQRLQVFVRPHDAHFAFPSQDFDGTFVKRRFFILLVVIFRSFSFFVEDTEEDSSFEQEDFSSDSGDFFSPAISDTVTLSELLYIRHISARMTRYKHRRSFAYHSNLQVGFRCCSATACSAIASRANVPRKIFGVISRILLVGGSGLGYKCICHETFQHQLLCFNVVDIFCTFSTIFSIYPSILCHQNAREVGPNLCCSRQRR